MIVAREWECRRGVRRKEARAPKTEDVLRRHIAGRRFARDSDKQADLADRIGDAHTIRPAAERVVLGHEVGAQRRGDRCGLEVERAANGVNHRIRHIAGAFADLDAAEQNRVRKSGVETKGAVADRVDRMAVDEHLRLVRLGTANRDRRVRAGLVRTAAGALDLDAGNLVENVDDLILPLAADRRCRELGQCGRRVGDGRRSAHRNGSNRRERRREQRRRKRGGLTAQDRDPILLRRSEARRRDRHAVEARREHDVVCAVGSRERLRRCRARDADSRTADAAFRHRRALCH